MENFTCLYVRAAISRFVKDERGVTAIEYAIIGVAIATTVAAVFADTGGLKTALDKAMTTITSKL
ncbi:Flp family type IVb pilin [Vibrio tapetis subsp. quintayensis]|uniref:Flp family type IVb pilin n=1 Tax=Vibrio tapetis TaxID=52443 RepID=UPI0025B5DB1E|nr:Flp family type IVb pilin [Vibrio tapetis]MDN3681433.1 Flp family type IVb pilin [Vibrio tapetis subsp. quintayensis]